MQLVRFTRSFRVWAGGEIAGFTPDMAVQLVRDGVAVEVDPAEVVASAPVAPEAPQPVAVRFVRPHGIWNSGEVAGFAPAVAAKLVDSEAAVLLSDDEPEDARSPPSTSPRRPTRSRGAGRRRTDRRRDHRGEHDMAVQDSVTLRNARAAAIEATIGASPTFEVRSGLPPANAAAADTGTLLATITLPADWLGAASGGAVTQLGSWAGAASASGVAGHFRIKASGTTHRQGLLSQPWTASTAYLVGQQVHNGGAVYRCTTAGTSAGTGGPSGTGGSIADGTAVWAYVGPGPDLTLDNTNIVSGQAVTFSDVQFTEGNA